MSYLSFYSSTSIRKYTNLMRKYIFPLEKVVLFLFYLESMVIMQADHKQYFWIVVALVSIISYLYQGARPYTPIFFLIAVTDYLQLDILQTICIAVLGFLVVYMKFYHIQIVGKGPYNAGYKYLKEKEYEISIFYPSMADGEHAKWIPSENYSSALYEIAFVNPLQARLPFRIFNFIVSFLFKMKMPVLGDASLYINDFNKEQTWNLIVFSHGLGSNLNNYSSLCGWWASHGYIVVSIQHNKDLVRIDFPKKLVNDIDALQKLLYQNRNTDLVVRRKEMELVLDEILENKLLDKVFNVGKEIKVEKIYLVGHSFGGATALETMASLIQQKKVSPLIKGIICMDAWFFPLSNQTYETVVDQNILLINSQTFFTVVPFFYYMQEKMARLRQNNKKTMKTFVVDKTDHLSVSDFVFTFGNMFKMLKTVRLQQYAKPIMELHEIIISMFMEGESKEKILQVTNSQVRKYKLDQENVKVLEQWRFERSKRNTL